MCGDCTTLSKSLNVADVYEGTSGSSSRRSAVARWGGRKLWMMEQGVWAAISEAE